MLMPVKKMMNFAPLTCNLGSEDSLNMRNASLIQRGFTLVELMVAMAIGLFIVLIAITIYTQGLSSVAFRMGQSENLNNSRYTIGMLDSEFSKAGFRRDPTQLIEQAFPADAAAHANGCLFIAGQAIYAPNATSLCIRYQARDSGETNCAGTTAGIASLGPYEAPASGAGLLVERYTIVNKALVCQAGVGAVTSTQVADGVRDVHFEFGIGKKGDTLAQRRVQSFKTDVPTADEAIRALRYAVLLSSTGKVTQGMTSTVCTRWAEAGGNASSCDATAGQLLQLVTGSLTLRNLMP